MPLSAQSWNEIRDDWEWSTEMQITQVRLPDANVVIALATSGDGVEPYQDAHEFLNTRGAVDSGEQIDLLFVVAEALDPPWQPESAALCQRAKLTLVQPMVRAEAGATQFPEGPTIFYEWMLRSFDAIVVAGAAPFDVLKHCIDFLSSGYVGTDFADLHLCLANARILTFHRIDAENDVRIRDVIARDAGLRSQLDRASHVVAVAYAKTLNTTFATIKEIEIISPRATLVAQACPPKPGATPRLTLLLAERQTERVHQARAS